MKNALAVIFRKFFKQGTGLFRRKEEKNKDLWAKNLFSDLGRLKGRLIVMRMG